MPTQFPLWTRTLGSMLNGGCAVRALCDRCKGSRDVDLDALAARVGLEYSLIDRRCRCRLTAGCRGWNRFYYRQAVFRPLWTDERARQWCVEP